MQLVTIFVNYATISMNPESQTTKIDKDSPMSFYDDVLVEILCIFSHSFDCIKSYCKENCYEYGYIATS